MSSFLPWILTAVAIVLAGIAIAKLLSRSPAPAPAPDRPAVTTPKLAPGDRHLLLLMIDGLPSGPFEQALAAGAMPRVQRLFEERPTLKMRAISTFPSATAPSMPELLAGRFVDLEEMPAPGAVHAFDRERRRIVRYITEPDTWDWPIPNLFDALAAADLSAVTVFEGRWDGPESILTTAAVARAAAREVIGAGGGASGDRGPVQALLSRIHKKGVPRVTLVVFNDVDMKGHFHGPDSAEVAGALVSIDGLIGEILDVFARERTASGARILDETDVLLFGDHGMVASGRFLDLVPFFASRKLSAYDASTLTHVVLREPLGSMWTRWPDVVLVSGGSNITQIYLRAPEGGWDDVHPAEERERQAHVNADVETLAQALAELEGVGQVLRSVSPDVVEIRAPGNSRARIVQRTAEGAGAPRFAYVVPDEAREDPLGYLQDPKIAALVARESRLDEGAFHDADTWMQRTLHARYPAAVPLVPKGFHPRRFTGDLMVTALPGWSFLRSQHGDHGNLERDAMMTSLVLNGPGAETARAPAVPRLVDIFPTAAVLLGADPDDPALRGLDGRPIPGIRGPAPRASKPAAE